MHSPDTYSNTHDHPFHQSKHGRAILAATAVAGLISLGAMTNAHGERRQSTPAENTLTEEQLFDSQVTSAIEDGPTDPASIIGIFPVDQDRTIANAMIQEAAKKGYPLDIENSYEDRVTVTLSANAFADEHNPAYNPDDRFVLYKQDVNHDGKDEILVKSVPTEQ